MRSAIDELVAHSDTALIVVTTASQDQRAGCLVGFHTQCSIEPFRYAVWLSKANHTYRVALFATHFAVHFVSTDGDDLAELFGTRSGDEVDKFSMCQWTVGPGGVPILSGLPSILFERQTLWDDGSDHACVVGVPVGLDNDQPFEPFRLSDASRLQAGHDVTERPVPDLTSASSASVADLREVAAGFGHEITAEQLEETDPQSESAIDDPR